MRHAPRRLAVVLTLAALFATAAAGSALGQASDSGGANNGESASAWHDVLAFLGWILLVIVVLGLLVWMLRGRRREGARPDAAEAAPGPAKAAPAPVAPWRPGQDAQELAVLSFDHIEGAERAYADARGRANDAPWLREVVFVECHRHDRIVVRGTFAGHYLDVDDVADAIGHDTAVGAVAGAVVGLAFGPPGFAAGLVAGASRAACTNPPPTLRGRAGRCFDEIRRDIPQGSSGIVALTSSEDSAALIDALHARAVRVTHHRLSDSEAAALQAAVVQAPRAAPTEM